MAPAASVLDRSDEATLVRSDEASIKHKQKVLKSVRLHILQMCCQHLIVLQSEPMMMREVCRGDVAMASRYLGGSAGIVGLLGLIINQAGGKLSDAVGRKPFMFLGSIVNMLVGALVYARGANGGKLFFMLCRILRMVGTTFSGTVIATAAMQDTFTPQEFPQEIAKVQASVGLAVVLMPILEGALLSRSGGNIRLPYLALAAIAATQMLVGPSTMVETLAPEKRRSTTLAEVVKSANPLSFLKLFTGPNKTLKQLMSMITLQQFLEGKNLSDLGQLYMVNQLKWGVAGVRNCSVMCGFLAIVQAAAVVPMLLKKHGVVGYTQIANMSVALGNFMEGSAENGLMYIAGIFTSMPGMNGSTSIGIRGVANKLAFDAGYGSGEFSGMYNNLRACAGACATTLLGFTYAWCRENNVSTGYTYFLAGIIGGAIPQLMLQSMDKASLQPKA